MKTKVVAKRFAYSILVHMLRAAKPKPLSVSSTRYWVIVIFEGPLFVTSARYTKQMLVREDQANIDVMVPESSALFDLSVQQVSSQICRGASVLKYL